MTGAERLRTIGDGISDLKANAVMALATGGWDGYRAGVDALARSVRILADEMDDVAINAQDVVASIDHYEEVITDGHKYADGVIDECFSLLLEYREKLSAALAAIARDARS